MELSQFTDYSLRTLMYLAIEDDEPPLTSIDEIAFAYGISKNHLVKVVHNLAKLDYIDSFRGRSGGISLAKAPKDINIGILVRQTEKLAMVDCFEGRAGDCCLNGVCELKHLLSQATSAFLSELDRATLADLTQSKSKMKNRLQLQTD